MTTDIEIAQSIPLQSITEVAEQKLGLQAEQLYLYGPYKAKLSLVFLQSLADKPRRGKLILVTAINPTPAGEGKTTTTIGLGDALNRLGKKTLICLREPSLGPCFGIKGGATGGGYAQVAPMEEINLHFTGDFHAVAAAHNLLAAAVDNHLHHGNELDLDVRKILWKRVVDMNDRALRNIVVGLGGPAHGVPRESGFDIVVASEVMAILCLSHSLQELRQRLGRILVGYTKSGEECFAEALKVHGAMAALLRDAFLPNIVQTLEHNPAFIHGGPFANIAHGCNSLIATDTALRLADFVVTEAGFGADLGAEKFLDIKCRRGQLHPDVVVLVATVRALKMHGGLPKERLSEENLEALEKGFANLERHFRNLTEHFGLPVVIAINHFASDTDQELNWLRDRVAEIGGQAIVCTHWREGGQGAIELAEEVVRLAEEGSNNFRFLYPDDMPLWEKIETVARKIYHAAAVEAESRVRQEIAQLDRKYRHYPVCIAKTQYSFSADSTLLGAPEGHTLPVRQVVPCHGAEFLVVLCGDVLTMPGLPRRPAAERIDLNEEGQIVGLF